MKLKPAINGYNVCLFFWVFVLLALSFCVQAVEIDGTVVDFYGTVEDAEVFLVDSVSVSCGTDRCRSESSTSDETGSDGEFIVHVVPPSYGKQYNLTIIKENYKTEVKQITLNSESKNMLLGEIELKGIANLDVTVFDPEYREQVGGVEVSMTNKKAKTDVNGRLILENLTAETKMIKVRHNDYEQLNFEYDLKPGENFLEINVSKKPASRDYAVSFHANYSQLIIGAGEVKKFGVDVRNIGLNDADFKLEFPDREENLSYRALNEKEKEIKEIFIKSGRTVKVYVEINATSNAKKGEHSFRLKAYPGDSEITFAVNVVKQSFFLSAEDMDKIIEQRSEVKFKINLKNNPEKDIYKIDAVIPKDWKHNITDISGRKIREAEVTPNGELNLYLTLKPPKDEDEGLYETYLNVTGSEGNETKTLTFKVILNPGQEPSLRDDWRVFMHDLERTGNAPGGVGNPKNLGIAWRFETAGTTPDFSPAVFGNYVYAGAGGGYITARGYVYCLNKNTGELNWSVKIKSPVTSSPAVSGSYVYVGSSDGYVYGLNKNTGEVVWNFETGGYVSSSPAVSGNYVYFGSSDNYAYCLNKHTGELKWKFKTGDQVRSSPAISGDYVYFGSLDGFLYCLDKNTGELKWKSEAKDSAFSQPAISGDYVYTGYGGYSGNDNGLVYCLNKSTGELKWKFETDGAEYPLLAVSEDYVYAGSGDKYLYCINKNTGELAWKFETGGKSWTESLTVSGNHVYVSLNNGSYNGWLHVLDKKTGKFISKFEAGGSIGKFAVSGGYVYAGVTDSRNNNYIYAFTDFNPIGSSCSKDSECKTKNCFKDVCREEGYCDSDADCYYDQYCGNGLCSNLKPMESPCSGNPECKTNNCFNGACMPDGYCDSGADCPSDTYCFESVCKTFNPEGSSCLNDSECKTNNCFNGICRKEGYVEIPWLFVLFFAILPVLLVMVYFTTAKKKKSNAIMLCMLILIIIEIILLSNAFGLFKSGVVDKTIPENETISTMPFIKISGAGGIIEVETYKEGILSTEKFPAGNFTLNTGYGKVSINENLECTAGGVCSECCGKSLMGCNTEGCYVRRGEGKIEIIISDPGKNIEYEILKNDGKFGEITAGRAWDYVLEQKSCCEIPAGMHCPNIHIWFVVEGKKLYMADVNTDEYRVTSLKEFQSVGSMKKDEIKKTIEMIEGLSCI